VARHFADKSACLVARRPQCGVDHEQCHVLAHEPLQGGHQRRRPVLARESGHRLIRRQVERGVEVDEAVHAADVRQGADPPAERESLRHARGRQGGTASGVEQDDDAVDPPAREFAAQQLVRAA
jgi:hypothetical protein